MHGDAAATAPPMRANGRSPVHDGVLSSTRLDAIAKLRRAASNREVRQAKTPLTVPAAAKVSVFTPSSSQSDAPLCTPPIPTSGADSTVEASGQRQEEAGAVSTNVPCDTPSEPKLREPVPAFPPLLTLEQLRHRILQERRPTGLSRSASTSATSQVARAYTMQKLLGASTPISYNDMFAFVRGASQARTQLVESSSQDEARPLAWQNDTGVPSGNAFPTASTPEGSRRATLIRSVSARSNARPAFRKGLRHASNERISSSPGVPFSVGSTPPRGEAACAAGSGASDDQGSAQGDSSSTSSWRVSLYDYEHTSPTMLPTGGLAPVATAPSEPKQVDGTFALPRMDAAVAGRAAQSPHGFAEATNDETVYGGLANNTHSPHSSGVERSNTVTSTKTVVPTAAIIPKSGPPSPVASTPAPFPGASVMRERSHSSSSASVPRAMHTPRADVFNPAWPPKSTDLRTDLTTGASTPIIPTPPYLPAMPVPHDDVPPALAPPVSAPLPRADAPLRADNTQKPLPRVPTSKPVGMREYRLGDSLRPAPRRPSPTPSLDVEPTAHREVVHMRSNSTGAFAHDDGDSKKETRVGRLFGSLRRKTSRRGLGSQRRQGKTREPSSGEAPSSAQAPPAPAHLLASVVLGTDASDVPLHDTVVVLPVTPAALMRWNQTLPRPVRHVLAPFPAEVPLDTALDPPRQLLRVLPLLETAGDEYVKLRYLFLFQDVVVLVKPVLTPRAGETLSDCFIRKIGCVPDLGEWGTPFAVLDLRDLYLDDGRTTMREDRSMELAMLVQRRSAQLYAHSYETLRMLRTEADLPGTEAQAHAQLLFACTSLDRYFVADYLYAHHDVLEQYVRMHHIAGAPLEVALRCVLAALPWPRDLATFEVLLFAFSAHWHAVHAAEPDRLSLECVTDLTFAMLGLNDALHDATGLFARPNPTLSLDRFVQLFRVHDAQARVSDQMLSKMYVAIKSQPLMPGVSSNAWRTMSFDAQALSEPLIPGVPSAPVRVSLDAPDPDVRVLLLGRGLYMDPPVLTFTHAAHSEFTVCATAPGTYELLFLRTGRRAPMYMNHLHHGAQRALPLHMALECVPAPASPLPKRRTVSLVHMPADGTRRTFTFCMTDQAMSEHATSCLRRQIDAAQQHTRRLPQTELDVHTLGRLVLESTLLQPPADATDAAARQRAAARSGTHTGAQIVRLARENSLLAHVLCTFERRIIT